MPAYHHHLNAHSLAGAAAALPLLLRHAPATSLLDVGCGTGTWLRAALDAGVPTVQGVDGVPVPADQLLISPTLRHHADLTRPWSAGQTFDLTLCLEVAEHLPPDAADTLIDTLTAHSTTIAFSAACPGQPGENHLHTQWPAYWQSLFNQRGYACDDTLRWQLWENTTIEPWYRQNLFIARRSDMAGSEPRLPPVIHPDLLPAFQSGSEATHHQRSLHQIEHGSQPLPWYLTLPLRALSHKLTRLLPRSGARPAADPSPGAARVPPPTSPRR